VGFFDRFFVNRTLSSLANSAVQLRLAVFGLLVEKYVPVMGQVEGGELAVGVMNYALIEEPTTQSRAYAQHHSERMEEEAGKLWADAKLAEALSYLYAALIMQACVQERAPTTQRGADLANRASELCLRIPNTYDICGTSNARESVGALAVYANDLAKEVAARRVF
jgi:hypothetical protein